MGLFSYLEHIDQQLFLFINGKHSTTIDPIMVLISEKYTWIPFYVILLLVIGKKIGWKKTPLILVLVAATITLSDQISVHLFKNIFLRYRPCHNEELKHIIHLTKGCGGMYGFVSSHAANSFALATFIGLLLKQKLRFVLPFLFIWASLVSYSRIYNGVHYPSDILFGGLLGIIIGYFLLKIYSLLTKS